MGKASFSWRRQIVAGCSWVGVRHCPEREMSNRAVSSGPGKGSVERAPIIQRGQWFWKGPVGIAL